MILHVHRPPSFRWRAVRRCPRCRVRRRLVVTSFVWYGPEVVCCTCGAWVSDGHLRRATKGDGRAARAAAALWPALPNRNGLVPWLKEQVG